MILVQGSSLAVKRSDRCGESKIEKDLRYDGIVSGPGGPNPTPPSLRPSRVPPPPSYLGIVEILRDTVLLDLFAGILLVLEPSRHPAAPDQVSPNAALPYFGFNLVG
jgi:hypothetical protein